MDLAWDPNLFCDAFILLPLHMTRQSDLNQFAFDGFLVVWLKGEAGVDENQKREC